MLRRLFSYMGRYKKYAFLALFCIAVESAVSQWSLFLNFWFP